MMGRQVHRINWKGLSEDLRAKRAEERIEQKDAARQMGIAASSLSRLERGKTCSADTYMSVCSWLEVDPTEYSMI